MKLFLISGRARNGKGTIGNIIKQSYESKGKKVCFIQVMRTLKGYLKDYFGWDGSEETKPRTALQQIGTELIREKLNKPEFHIQRLIEDITILENFFDVFIVDDIRLPLEIELLKDNFPEVISINVTRKDYQSNLTKTEQEHFTEHALDNYQKFDYNLINRSIVELEKEIQEIIEKEVEKDEKNDEYRN